MFILFSAISWLFLGFTSWTPTRPGIRRHGTIEVLVLDDALRFIPVLGVQMHRAKRAWAMWFSWLVKWCQMVIWTITGWHDYMYIYINAYNTLHMIYTYDYICILMYIISSFKLHHAWLNNYWCKMGHGKLVVWLYHVHRVEYPQT